MGAEHTIGMLSLLARDDKGIDAVAETNTQTQTLALPADDLFSAFEDDFGILYNQIRELATQTLRLRRRTPEGAYLTGSLQPRDLPTGDIDLVQKLLMLRQDVFRNANVEALIAMAQRMRTVRFKPNTRLWSIGAPSGFLYAMLAGRVRCTTEEGTQFRCGPGYPLGHLESQCDAPRWYEAVTDAPGTALQIDIDMFLDTLEQHYDMAIAFIAGMASALIARCAEIRDETASAVIA